MSCAGHLETYGIMRAIGQTERETDREESETERKETERVARRLEIWDDTVHAPLSHLGCFLGQFICLSQMPSGGVTPYGI